jgi:hypothetical protein
MTTTFGLATALRTTLAAALVAFALPVFADVRGGCDNKDCERTAGDLGRSVKAVPAPQALPIVKQPWAVAQSTSETTVIIDPYGNVFTGPARAGTDRPVFRLNLQRIDMQTGKPLTAAPGEALPKLQARHYSVALAGTNGEFAVIADNRGNVYSGSIRPPVDIAPLTQAVRSQGGRNCTKVDCE